MAKVRRCDIGMRLGRECSDRLFGKAKRYLQGAVNSPTAARRTTFFLKVSLVRNLTAEAP